MDWHLCAIVFIAGIAVGASAMGRAMGRASQRDCADAAIASETPLWWKHELIDARARAEKERMSK